jgi:predicted RNase H-like HicB family nuclease
MKSKTIISNIVDKMREVRVIAEKTDTGYSAYLPDVPGIIAVGDIFNELRENVAEAVDLYLQTCNEFGDPIPEALSGKYKLAFKFDTETFLEWLSGVMSQKGLSEIANINESLISQYAHGVKKPGPKQLKRIETALHKFADDLYAISF